MRALTPKHKAQIQADPYFKVCARKNGECQGRITKERAAEILATHLERALDKAQKKA